MKIILSRKGFDSASGGFASPILPGDRLLSIPIPSKNNEPTGIQYKDIKVNGHSMGDIVEDLTKGRIPRDHYVHFDPDLDADLDASSYRRSSDWRPLFCPGGKAHHLQSNGVTIGDLFLFFGWFKRTEHVGGKYRYIKGEPDLHVIFGWCQVGSIVSDGKDVLLPWARHFPHFQSQSDVVYVSKGTLELRGIRRTVKGAGRFDCFKEHLRLTSPHQDKRSVWRLPRWFYPRHIKDALTYHQNRKRWKRENGHAILNSVGRGQEFVLDAEKYPEAISWAREVIELAID